jgi:hypothetical protein
VTNNRERQKDEIKRKDYLGKVIASIPNGTYLAFFCGGLVLLCDGSND